jgi:hypothetical protein
LRWESGEQRYWKTGQINVEWLDYDKWRWRTDFENECVELE